MAVRSSLEIRVYGGGSIHLSLGQLCQSRFQQEIEVTPQIVQMNILNKENNYRGEGRVKGTNRGY